MFQYITLPENTTIKSELTNVEIIMNALAWLVLIVVTLGIATFFSFYYNIRLVLNNTYIIDSNQQKVAKFNCNLNFGDILGHALLWGLITLMTLGLGVFIYFYKATQFVLSKTVIEKI